MGYTTSMFCPPPCASRKSTPAARRILPGWRPRRGARRLSCGLACLSLFLAGCATRGPNHIYLTTAADRAVHDLGPSRTRVTDVIFSGEQVLGLAYDFNTDHLFLRVAPAQVIRVVERPSGKILREMPLPVELQTAQPADLAIRASDRHLFAAHPDGKSIVELTLFGQVVRRIELANPDGAIGGLAYDQKNRRLLVLFAGSTPRVGAVAPDGNVTYYVTFPAPLNPVSLGYDSDAARYFVPLAGLGGLGEFDSAGNQVAVHAAGGQPITALDAGPRSFVRVF